MKTLKTFIVSALVGIVGATIVVLILRKRIFRSKFENWAGNLKCNPGYMLVPKTVSDISNYLIQNPNVRISIFGSGHSW
jgi:hypothetical protein